MMILKLYMMILWFKPKFLISISDSQNEDISTLINLGECENKLKDNITSSSSSQQNNNLYIFSFK